MAEMRLSSRESALVFGFGLRVGLAVILLTAGWNVRTMAQETGASPPRDDKANTQAKAPGKTGDSDGIQIDDRFPPPNTYPHDRYEYRFQARGNYVPTLTWRLIGTPPPGLRLEEDGLLHGEPLRAGEYKFTVSVTDSGSPRQAVEREFAVHVIEAITLAWKKIAHVNGGRIEGSVEVSNTTPDNIDLTFIVEAVAENGRATAIGYQHFVLPRGTTDKEIPFGENLPHGSYLVNVDAIGEVARKNQIFRQRMQTPTALPVAVGP